MRNDGKSVIIVIVAGVIRFSPSGDIGVFQVSSSLSLSKAVQKRVVATPFDVAEGQLSILEPSLLSLPYFRIKRRQEKRVSATESCCTVSTYGFVSLLLLPFITVSFPLRFLHSFLAPPFFSRRLSPPLLAGDSCCTSFEIEERKRESKG